MKSIITQRDMQLPENAIEAALSGYAENTKKVYSMHIRRFLEWCQENGRFRFDAVVVMEYAATLSDDGVGASSINQSLAIIRGVAEKMWMSRLVPLDEYERIKAVKGAKIEKGEVGTWLSPEQVGLIYGSILSMPRSDAAIKRDRLLFGVMVGCGLRISEACRLTHADLTTYSGIPAVNIRMSKGSKSRVVVMTEIAQQAVAEWLAYSGNVTGQLIRHVTRGGGIQQKGIKTRAAMNIVNAIVVHAHAAVPELAAIPSLQDGLESHNLRRTYAIILYTNGVPLATIQKLLGHASIETTRLYIGGVSEIAQHIANIRILG